MHCSGEVHSCWEGAMGRNVRGVFGATVSRTYWTRCSCRYMSSCRWVLMSATCRSLLSLSALRKCCRLMLDRRRSTSGRAVRSSAKHRNWTALLHDRSVSASAADRSTSTAIQHLRFVSRVSGVNVACCGQQMCASFRWAVLLLIEVKLVVVSGWISKVGGVRGDARARGGFV